MASGTARRDGAAGMKRALMVAAALAALAPAAVVAQDQPTAELQALDDALPGSLINDP